MDAEGKTQKRRRGSVDSFTFFRQAAAEILKSLISEFGLAYVATLEHVPECVIKYQNATTGLTVSYEWKSQISIDLVKLARTPTEVAEDKSYDLLLLMEIRRPEIDAHKFYGGDKEWTNNYIEERLREYANFLKEDARDVLTGDFRVFPELKKLSAKYRRQTNKEYFGTYCGESPRFSSRPTLEQVFDGAKEIDPELERLFGGKVNQDKTQFRIYEAYWDHEYSIRQIADFLKQTEESIQRELDDYDDHG
jgi:hypothetical protein